MITFSGSNGVRLAADTWGDAGDPPVLMMHGGGQTRHAWGRTAAVIAAEGWFVVSLDLRGHGDSGWAVDGDYSYRAFVDDAVEVASTFDERPVIVGASLGGIAAIFTGAGDDPVARAVVLVDVVHRPDPAGVARIGGFMRAHLDGFASLEEAADVIAAYTPNRPRRRDVSGLANVLRLGEDGRFHWHWDPAFVQRPAGMSPVPPDDEFGAAVAALSVPTLIVRGGASDVVNQDGIDAFLALAPHASWVQVPGASHMVAGDKNDAFSTAVLSFLAQLAGGRAA